MDPRRGSLCDAYHRSLQSRKGCKRVTFSLVEAGLRDKKTTIVEDELALKLGALILRCMGPQGGEVLRVIDESGLTFAQMKVLVELQMPDEEHTVTSLAENIGISTASASRAAEGMVQKKLATRLEDPDDRRVKRLALTAKGQRLADRIISARLASLEEFTGSLEADERRKLESALDALMKRPEVAEIYANYERKVSR
jgi:DNA-binding MarR family transcriptional regulator